MRSIISIIFILTSLVKPAEVAAFQERNLLQGSMTVEQLKTVLIPGQQWISYPAYNDRLGWDKLTGSMKQEIIQQGEKALDYTWQVVKATDYIEYERSGSRQIMQDPFGANNSALANLFLAELAEGKGRFIDQIINGVWLSCEMTSWVLSAHLPAYQTSRRSLADPEEHVIDLTAGDLGSMLAWTWYYLKDEMDKVNPVISRRLRNELQKRILDPYMERSDFWWQAFNATPQTMVNNWNPWCNFNVLTCYLILENDPDKLARAVYRTMISTDKFINYNNDDGACEEGPSYWGHAAGKLYDYLQILYYATNGKLSIFKEPIIKNLGEYIGRSYIGDGWVVNFADASAKGGGDKGVIFRYGKAVGSQEMQKFAAYLHSRDRNKGYSGGGRDIFRNFENLVFYNELVKTSPELPKTSFSWYPQTEFCYMRNNSGFFLAAKGGYNNESHNHNDVGSFLLYFNNKPVFIDVGVGTYTRQTFSDERYSIWTMQSNYHNLPLINGKPQQNGAQYRSKNVTFDENKLRFSVDISGGYHSDAAIKSWIRSYSMATQGEVIIDDVFALAETIEPNQVNFMTLAKPDISIDGVVNLLVDGNKVQLTYDKKRFTPTVETIKQDDIRLSNIWGNEIYRISLTAKDSQMKGTYKFTVKAL
jgi:hypothetical protein